jgi:hypothetical protein
MISQAGISHAAISVRAGASISSSRCRPIRDSRIAITPTITSEP